jgi:puromycin-sensitive aminopeptidase
MVLACVSKRGDKADFDRMLELYHLATSPEDKVTLAHALTNFRKLPEIKRALSLIKSEHVRLQDVSYWIAFAFANPMAKNLTWEWLKDNWFWLKDNMENDMSYPRLPMYVARAFSDKSFIMQYSAFFHKVYEPALDRAIKQGLETIKMQAAWRKRDEEALLNWLSNR